LGDAQCWENLVAFMSDPDPVVSLACARALLKIDMVKAAPAVMAAVPERTDWSLTRIGSLIKDSDPTVMCAAARDAISCAPAENLPRLLRLLSALDCRNTLDVVMTALDSSDDAETVAACLRVLDDPRGLTTVRWYVNDERWPVRLQAVRALGRLGQVRDTDALMGALTDEVWWVRYRAAESLSMMPFLEDVDLARLQRNCEDSYGRDMLALFRRLRELRGPTMSSRLASPMPPGSR
jgi:HEAT repeat protein